MTLFVAKSEAELAAMGFNGWGPTDFRPAQTISRYGLFERIACEPPDECYLAESTGLVSIQRPVFLRSFPPECITPGVLDYVQSHAAWTHAGVAQILEFGVFEGAGFTIVQYADGISLTDIASAIDNGEPVLSWQLAVFLLVAMRVPVAFMHSKGVVHGYIDPARIRFSVSGRALLCPPLPPPNVVSPKNITAERRAEDFRALARAIMPLAAEPQDRESVIGLCSMKDSRSLIVLGDFILEKQPDFPEAFIAVLRLLAQDLRTAEIELAGRLRDQLPGRVSDDNRRDMLSRIVRYSSDYNGLHERMPATTPD